MLILGSGRTKPPAGAGVSWGHALATNLIDGVTLTEGTGAPQSISRRTNGVLTSAAWVGGNAGNAISLAGNGNVNYGVDGLGIYTRGVSAFCRARTPASFSGANRTLFQLGGSTSLSYAYHAGVASDGSALSFVLSGVVAISSGFTLAAATWYDISFAYTRSDRCVFNVWVLSRSPQANMYRTTTVSDGSAPSTNARSGMIGDVTGAGASWSGIIECAYFYGAAISQQMAAALHDEPYSMLAVPAWRRYFDMSPAAGGVTYPQLERGVRGLNRGLAEGLAGNY